ncbi:MAG TPA: GAF domain-containing protein [Vicinamibacteria bacterium]|nr:GAF domain-containing protein [Vicinamibacteria bacterium]
MAAHPTPLPDSEAQRRANLLKTWSRFGFLALGFLTLFALWNHPQTRRREALALGVAYFAFTLAAGHYQRRAPGRRAAKVLHDVVDALAVGAGSFLTGRLESPGWLLFYPHVVANAVRGGLAYGVVMAGLDAVLLAILAVFSPGERLLAFHCFALLACAFTAGTTASHLREVRARLASALEGLRRGSAEQERSLLQLKASEDRYRRLLERIQDGVLIIQEGRLAYANAVFGAMVGEAPDALLGRPFVELLPAEDRKELQDRYERWEASQGGSGLVDTRIRTTLGATLLVSVRAGSVEFEGRRSVIATVRDVTRQREMEQEIKAHAGRLAAINEIANAVNLSLRIEDIFGVAADEVRHLVPFDRLTIALLHEERPGVEIVAVSRGARRQTAPFARDAVAWAFRRPRAWHEGSEEPAPHLVQGLLAEAGIRSVATLPLLSKERVIGSMNLGRFEARPFTPRELEILDPVARHVAIALDNARLLEDVRRRGQEFESLLEVGRGIVTRLELGELLPLVVRSVNRIMGTHFCVLLLRHGELLRLAAQEGLEPEVVKAFLSLRVGESLSGLVAKEGRALAVDEMKDEPRAKFADITTRYGYRSFLCVPLKHGSEVLGTLEVVTKEPRRFGPEEQELMAAFAAQAAVAIANARLFEQARRHVAETDEANRRLEELDRLRREYLRNVSHEFRTPLTVIRGYADYLLESVPETDKAQRDVLKIVLESSDRLIDLVDTLIEVSRIEQGITQQTLRVERLDLRELAEAGLEPLRRVAEKKGIPLCLEFPAGPMRFQGDQSLLLQVIRKLVDNALKYSSSGGRVTIRGGEEEHELLLQVADTGIGIAPEHIPRIFEKFYTVDGSLARKAGGTGVGLYLVREILRLHRGSVAVQSEPGRGSVFSVRVPKSFAPAPPEAALA